MLVERLDWPTVPLKIYCQHQRKNGKYTLWFINEIYKNRKGSTSTFFNVGINGPANECNASLEIFRTTETMLKKIQIGPKPVLVRTGSVDSWSYSPKQTTTHHSSDSRSRKCFSNIYPLTSMICTRPWLFEMPKNPIFEWKVFQKTVYFQFS